MVVAFATGTDVLPAAFLLLEIETGGVGEEEKGEDHSTETEPRNDVELLLGGDVVVHDSRKQSATLSARCGESVGGRTDRGRVDFGSDEEGDCIRTELIEKGREEVHGLEASDASFRSVVVEFEGWDDEEDEIHHETDHLHLFASVELVVD